MKRLDDKDKSNIEQFENENKVEWKFNIVAIFIIALVFIVSCISYKSHSG